MPVTNAQLADQIALFQKDSGLQREAIISGINDNTSALNAVRGQVAIANGKVAELYRDVRGDDRGHEGLLRQVRKLEQAHWKQAGYIGGAVAAVELLFHFAFK